MKKLVISLLLLASLSSFSQIPDGYYDATAGLDGDALKAALHNIIDEHTSYSYTSSSTDVWDILKESDRDPANPANVLLIYTGESVNAAQEYNNAAGWSREHVWAKSHGDFGTTPPAGTDAHHLRPCDISVNSARGNKDFDNGGSQHSEATECFTDSDSWEPRPSEKGDVARMMFYMATRYEGDVAGDPDLELVDYTSTDGPIFGKLSTLIQWNAEDPVDDFERNRNEVVYGYQGNRNPFVDHPEYVNLMYNIPNSAPRIEDQEFTIAENSAAGTFVDTITATDADYNEITFRILSGNTDDAFTIDASSGILTVNNTDALDYEVITHFYLNIEANDGSLTANATITITIENITGLSPVASNSDIKIYPNPVSGILYVNTPKNYSFDIYSVLGEKMFSTKDQELDIHSLNSGLYFVHIKDEAGESIKSIKLVKK